MIHCEDRKARLSVEPIRGPPFSRPLTVASTQSEVLPSSSYQACYLCFSLDGPEILFHCAVRGLTLPGSISLPEIPQAMGKLCWPMSHRQSGDGWPLPRQQLQTERGEGRKEKGRERSGTWAPGCSLASVWRSRTPPPCSAGPPLFLTYMML